MKRWIHASEDTESGYYLVTAYYDNRYRGRADEFSSDNFEEIVEKAHEYCSDGYYVEVENMGSGEGKRFDPEKWMESVERFGEVPESVYDLSDD